MIDTFERLSAGIIDNGLLGAKIVMYMMLEEAKKAAECAQILSNHANTAEDYLSCGCAFEAFDTEKAIKYF